MLDNHSDWDVRFKGKTCFVGCESAGVLLMDASDHNRSISNTIGHSGDGHFPSKPRTGASSDYNYVAYNDGSYSPHNAFESTFTRGDKFYRNIADHCDHGFWLSFSQDTTFTDNHIEGSKPDGIAIEHGAGNFLPRNEILGNGVAGIRLFRRQPVPDPSRDYVILQNRISANQVGVVLSQTYDVMATNNSFDRNGVAIREEKGSKKIFLRANEFTPAGGEENRNGF